MLSKTRAFVHRILAAVGLRSDRDDAARRAEHLGDSGVGPTAPASVEAHRLRGQNGGGW